MRSRNHEVVAGCLRRRASANGCGRRFCVRGSSLALALGKRVNVRFAGAEEVQENYAFSPARFIEAQKDEIFAYPFVR
jgi:hypothetical protein